MNKIAYSTGHTLESWEKAKQKKIPLMEIFGPTIQGEGRMIGQQTYFIRLGLCDYRCLMCDSMHAVDPISVKTHGRWLTQPEILEEFQRHRTSQLNSTNWITISGGNPVMHDLSWLIAEMSSKGYQIAVETQGTIFEPWIRSCDVVTISPKGPGMGEKFEPVKFKHFMTQMIGHKDYNVKIVIFNDEDIAFAEELISDYASSSLPFDSFYLSQGNPYPPGKLFLQPELSTHTEWLREYYLKTKAKIEQNPTLCNVRFLPQFHIWLYGNKPGV